MKLIKQSGHSYFEDLLTFNNDVIFSYNISNETCGYSERVSNNSIIISKKIENNSVDINNNIKQRTTHYTSVQKTKTHKPMSKC